jgi:predicted  nucleic acid-binding Zn-ribbon protein
MSILLSQEEYDELIEVCMTNKEKYETLSNKYRKLLKQYKELKKQFEELREEYEEQVEQVEQTSSTTNENLPHNNLSHDSSLNISAKKICKEMFDYL